MLSKNFSKFLILFSLLTFINTPTYAENPTFRTFRVLVSNAGEGVKAVTKRAVQVTTTAGTHVYHWIYSDADGSKTTTEPFKGTLSEDETSFTLDAEEGEGEGTTYKLARGLATLLHTDGLSTEGWSKWAVELFNKYTTEEGQP